MGERLTLRMKLTASLKSLISKAGIFAGFRMLPEELFQTVRVSKSLTISCLRMQHGFSVTVVNSGQGLYLLKAREEQHHSIHWLSARYEYH
jgi:hypothetical protein